MRIKTASNLSACRSYWKCRKCDEEYNKSYIEDRLIDEIQRRTMYYSLQDLKCMKCHAVKQRNLNRHCACAGNFELITKEKDFVSVLAIFQNIARFADLAYLSETIEWINDSVKV